MTSVGDQVTRFKRGDRVVIGNMTDSCQHCESCQEGHEQYCLNEPTWTYNSRERVRPDGSRSLKPTGDVTYGGYSTYIVAQDKFVLPLPDEIPMSVAAPLLCAGITTFSPLKQHKIGKGHLVGIAGIGGLGHLGIQFAKSLGATVVALTTSKWKIPVCFKRLGADDVIYTPDAGERKLYKNKFDFILSTIPVSHDVKPYLDLLKPGKGKYHVVGDMNKFPDLKGIDFVFKGRELTSSNVGGIPDTQEMLLHCAKHKIFPIVQMVPIASINEAMKMIQKKNVKFRFVVPATSWNDVEST